ncbi:hypothetical protein EMIHUDRAFT_435404 [Emiliania huxleyi CCMP1516]|uniref:Uncharacterized protein n=2 Tax=Emiliania huxleyi TaxID=2903 RepID=A0A0D3JM81_EMIH1|nr:hypothetical protein EMIHUDRAFT_435404 [Emiliania huxleyi CCMP1516]EOD24616.1 hypothetical protein EMIHUDRAFT_435404 [Emiliania huxleyi CCMP1516]|eukprot:XP_005777045.1 hypothetical protein EMIHUDRAFT_435404 [Emiliania huxleyi CCMP1516]
MMSILLLFVVSGANGLHIGALSASRPLVSASRALAALRAPHPSMVDTEWTIALQRVAAACLEEECSVNTVEGLISELSTEAERLTRDGTKTSKEQVATLLALGRLQALSQNPAANKNEIEKIVAGMARSFGTVKDYDFPGAALGYTGTPNKNKVGL